MAVQSLPWYQIPPSLADVEWLARVAGVDGIEPPEVTYAPGEPEYRVEAADIWKRPAALPQGAADPTPDPEAPSKPAPRWGLAARRRLRELRAVNAPAPAGNHRVQLSPKWVKKHRSEEGRL